MTFDLVLKNGHVIDPAQEFDGPADIAFANGKVAAFAPRIVDSAASHVHDASGLFVVPGLIDLHTHVYWAGTSYGVEADVVARASGMTTAVDAGSAGASNIKGLFSLVQPLTSIRLLAFINLSLAGICFDGPVGEAEDLRFLNVDSCVASARENASHVVGIKIRVGASSTGALGAMPLHMAVRASEMAGGLPVMAHIGAGMPPRLEDIVEPLRRGDILTHCCTPRMNSPISSKGELRDCMVAARERGVIMDVAHGSNSFGFDVAETMIELGFPPDVISSDVHRDCVNGPAHNILVTMSKFLCLGLPLRDVIRAATAAPAGAIKRPDLGTLAVGSVGDVALIEVKRGPVVFTDSTGSQLAADKQLIVQGIILGGRWFCPRE